MFACPHCQFENPIQNRFCQRCGNALKGLKAIVIPAQANGAAGCKQSVKASTLDGSAAETTHSAAVTGAPIVTVGQLLTEDNQLRGAKRYQLRHPEAANCPLTTELTLDVLDCEPAAHSPFIQLLDETLNDKTEEAVIQELLPAAALPYWQLQEHFYPMVPELQAAWQDENGTVVVVEDRSAWKSLANFVESTEIEALEFIHWFYEIVNLWQALTRFQAEASLLQLDNLRLDDDHILCIQRLIHGNGDDERSLQDLGQFWQALLQQFAGPNVPALENLIADIGAGIITDAATVLEILANIAENLQADESATIDGEDALLASGMPSAVEAMMPPLEEAQIAALKAETAPLPLSDLLSTEDLEDFEATEDADDSFEDNLGDLPTMALPMKLYRLDEVGRTHVGRQRNHNEDCFFAETQLQRCDSPSGSELRARGMYILCDGMGGHSGGEVASALAVNTLRNYFAEHWRAELPDEAMVKEAIYQANQAIFDKNEAEGRTGNARMGTTLVLVLVADHQIVIAHVGDSRLYSLTRQGFRQLTTDHEVGQREITRGVEPAIAYARPDAYQLTQALGPRDNAEVSPTVNTLQLSQDTLFLLCSDGLSDNDLLESHVETHLAPMLRSRHDLEEGVANLIDLANEHNGHDNITVIAVRIKMRPNLEAT